MLPADPNRIVASILGPQAAKLQMVLLSQKPRKADAIIFLQGDHLDRASKVYSLYKHGFAKHIHITGNNKLIGRGKRNEENDIHLSKLQEYLVRRGVARELISVDDQSMNTFDQAVQTIRFAKMQKWHTLLVVTSPYHLLRTYLAFVKQAQGQSWKEKIVMQPAGLSWDKPPGGRVKTAIEMLGIEMERMRRHGKDIATVEEGLKYCIRPRL